MKPFRFRAQAVLDLRRREEEAAKNALARQRAMAERAQQALAAAHAAVARAGEALQSQASAGAAHGTLTWHRSWIVRLRIGVQVAAHAAAEAERATAAAAAALGQAMQRRRVLERLRDRAWRTYCVDRDRAEIREMDQLATLRFAHRAIEGGTRDSHAHDRDADTDPDADLAGDRP
ncbi:MAG: flagellar export protein FliJ [Vicinamibacterales bacterium]